MSMSPPMAVRPDALPPWARALQSVLKALHESRERAARRIVEDYRRQCGE
jgi:hypothetical protein